MKKNENNQLKAEMAKQGIRSVSEMGKEEFNYFSKDKETLSNLRFALFITGEPFVTFVSYYNMKKGVKQEYFITSEEVNALLSGGKD